MVTPFSIFVLSNEALFFPRPVCGNYRPPSKIGLNNSIKNKFIGRGKSSIEDAIAARRFTLW
jgi:hypothetical protein